MKKRELYSRISPFLRPFGLPYALFMRKRRSLYHTGVLDAYAAPCPCVSVGNIAFGGSGKTPVVAFLLEQAARENKKAVVLSRGYGACPGAKPLLVRGDTPVEQAGDEPLMLARRFPEAPVVVFPRRSEAARFAVRQLKPDLLIMDDGMQHLALRRDVDLVLLRPDDLTENWNRVIPSGPWREGETALASADAFLLKADAAGFARLALLAEQRLRSLFRQPAPLFNFSIEPVGLRPLFPENGPTDSLGRPALLTPERYRDKPYVLVSGVASPEGVEKTAAELLGRPPVQHFAFADHHAYTAGDVQAVLKMSAAPLPVVCTAKDAVKLSAFAPEFGAVPVAFLETRAVFGQALFTESGFQSWWADRLGVLMSA
ncbi:MAG: tetraacyldisaccharide 4'-kinase [Desulfovibrio sp.]|jgi:tetraacyldisaccharide 4'-kinase|nr:tetraacyldisaccharide 4'-kinase [Desulfovibrio sp.]